MFGDGDPICPPFPPEIPGLARPGGGDAKGPALAAPVRARGGWLFVTEDEAADSDEPGALGRERCTFRLSASLLGDRGAVPWRLKPPEACARFTLWAAHTLDGLDSTREILVPDRPDETGAIRPGTFRAIRSLNPAFRGHVDVMPGGMALESSVTGPLRGGAVDDPAERDSFLYLRTAADPEAWALKVRNWGTGLNGDLVRRPPGASWNLPYNAFLNKSAEEARLPEADAEQVGFIGPSGKVIGLASCRPYPLVIDASLPQARAVFAEAGNAVLAAFAADGLRTDGQTETYRPRAGGEMLVVLRDVSLVDCPKEGPLGGGLAGAQFDVLRGAMNSVDVLVGYESRTPDLPGYWRDCGGRAATADEASACQDLWNRSRAQFIGSVDVAMWPNLYSLFSFFDAGRLVEDLLVPVVDLPLDAFLASWVAPDVEALGRGGWWEKFCLDWDQTEGLSIPEAKVPTPYGSVRPDAERQTVQVDVGDPTGRAERLAIYRQASATRTGWLVSMKWLAHAAQAGGAVQCETGFTSIDELQFSLASYAICRANAPADLQVWSRPFESLDAGARRRLRMLPGTLTLFPRFLHADWKSGVRLICTDDPANPAVCQFDCVEGGAIERPVPVSTLLPLVMDVLGGPFSAGAGTQRTTYLRLLLDAELGRPVDYGFEDGLYWMAFEHGEVVVSPELSDRRLLPRSYIPPMWAPRARAREALYLSCDVEAVEQLSCVPARAVDLAGRLPPWALTRCTDRRVGDNSYVANPLVLRRALESGLQDAGDPDRHVPGVPGIALRTVGGRGDATVPILPGTGRVFLYADSPTGRLWRRYFPESPGLGRGLVAQTVQGLLRRSRRTVRDAALHIGSGMAT